jgi:hypothetical protein
VHIGGYASSRDCRVNCGLRSADRSWARARPSSREAQRLGRATDRRPLPAIKLVDGYAQFAQTRQDSASGIADACGPKSPDSHRVVWGLTTRPPVSPAGFPPVSRLPAGFFPFVRLPRVSLRPAFSGWFPSAVAQFRFPFGFPPGSLSLEHSSRYRCHGAVPQALVPGGRDQGHQFCRGHLAWIARSARTAQGMGKRPGTMRCRHRIACYERPRAQDIVSPEPPIAAARCELFNAEHAGDGPAVVGRPPSSADQAAPARFLVSTMIVLPGPPTLRGTSRLNRREHYAALGFL